MQTRKIAYAVMGALMITSVLAGCGKKENTTTAGNEGNSQVGQTQESSSKSEEKQSQQSSDLLENEKVVFSEFSAQIPKGYATTGTAGIVVYNPKDTSNIYITRTIGSVKELALDDLTSENIASNISDYVWNDYSISEQIKGYTKDVPVSISNVKDVEINGVKMKKYEGKLTLAKSSSDKDTTWDCYIYGYAFETKRNTKIFFGIEQEQSQPADKIELVKKNMDAMINTVVTR